jgi:hypothetical protein
MIAHIHTNPWPPHGAPPALLQLLCSPHGSHASGVSHALAFWWATWLRACQHATCFLACFLLAWLRARPQAPGPRSSGAQVLTPRVN